MIENTDAVEPAQVPTHHFSEENAEPEYTDRYAGLQILESPAGWNGPRIVATPQGEDAPWAAGTPTFEVPLAGFVPLSPLKNYKTLRAVQLAAFHCTHPNVDGMDKSLFAYLALYSSGTSGCRAYPGNRNIADALALKDSATDARLSKNVLRGLIERTMRADGRSKASEYRLCLESEHFPVRTPGGEWLVEPEHPLVRFWRAMMWLPKDQHDAVFAWWFRGFKAPVPEFVSADMIEAGREMVSLWGTGEAHEC